MAASLMIHLSNWFHDLSVNPQNLQKPCPASVLTSFVPGHTSIRCCEAILEPPPPGCHTSCAGGISLDT